MAIQIIGASRATEAEASPLSTIDANLPPPTTAPALSPALADEVIRRTLDHENPVLRSFAIEQASRRSSDAWNEAIAAKLADDNMTVAADAVRALEIRKDDGSIEKIAERFRTGEGPVLISAAHALGELAPERLVELVSQRGRLDDEAYAVTAGAMACLPSPQVVEYLERALNRSGALAPERRSALFAAVLRSGHLPLVSRVVGLALEDSRREAPNGAVFPSRAALVVTAGIVTELADPKAGPQLFDFARELLEEIAEMLEGDQRTTLEDAVKRKHARDILAALEPILSFPEPADERRPGAPESMFLRRRGLLRALVDRREEVGQLELSGSALFIMAAAEAAVAVAVGGANEARSPAFEALAKALESNVGAAGLAHMTESELTTLFKEKTERQMRRVLNIVTHERTHRTDSFERLARALVDAGHGAGLFEAAADVESDRVHELVLAALERHPEQAEAIVLEALTRTPLEPKVAAFALRAVPFVRTERVALAIGRRFYELRNVGREAVTNAVLRLGDARLLPFVESRAFENEPEELAAVILGCLHGKCATSKLEALLERPQRDMMSRIALPLRCKRCAEVLAYRFERVLLDMTSKEPNGDPAFVGDTTCKACKTEDQLELTPVGAEILTREMLQLLSAVRQGARPDSPTVMPAETRFRGKAMGFAAALRAADKEVAESPSSIRARLERADLRMMLGRRHVDEDIDAALAVDPRAPEARLLQVAEAMKRGDVPAAGARAKEVLEDLASDASLRIYLGNDVTTLKAQLEDFALDCLERGSDALSTLDLSAARTRRAQRMAAFEQARTERDLEDEIRAEPPASPGPAAQGVAAERFKNVGRNDPCPCNSGKKFKKCHGARA